MVYANIEENKDIVDVLFMVIAGHGNVKDMTKYLRQRQNTISMKLQFLRKEKLVAKDKWNYSPNWKELMKLFRGLLVESVVVYSSFKVEAISKKYKTLNEEFGRYFADNFIKNFLESYAIQYLYLTFPQGRSPPSFEELSKEVVLHLWFLKPSMLKKVNPMFIGLKGKIAELENDIIDSFQCMIDENRIDSYRDDLDIIINKGEKEFWKVAKNRMTNKKGGNQNEKRKRD